MFRIILSSLVLLCLLCAPLQAQNRPQGMCDPSVEPAATLLLPYFELDFSDPNGLTTLFSINNAWSEPALVNITLWTDFGIPSINFPVFLTGYDVVTVNLRDIFEGNIPITADDTTDPNDTISPHGSFPEWDGSFTACENYFPFFQNPVISGHILQLMQTYHSGEPYPQDDLCAGENHGDGHMRGFITIDNANECTVQNPADSPSSDDLEYFVDGGQGIANNNNQIWGDFYLVNPDENSAIGEPLVHIQAFGDVADGTWQEGDATFYGRFWGDSAVDNREPLPSIFGMRYLSGGAFDGGTHLIAWRESDLAAPTTCGIALPDPLPLGQREVYAFSEQEEVQELCYDPGCPVCSPPLLPVFYNCMPLSTQRIDVANDFSFHPPVYDAGWLYLDLNQLFPEPAVKQAWVLAQVSASGTFSVGLPAAHLHSACDGLPEILDILPF